MYRFEIYQVKADIEQMLRRTTCKELYDLNLEEQIKLAKTLAKDYELIKLRVFTEYCNYQGSFMFE